MSDANLGWLFYKKMYEKGDDDGHIKPTMDTLLKVNARDDTMNAPYCFTLKTIYPGLLIGSGYTHGLSVESDAKIGFYFDHTTGLPNIPGSSIKGVLRSLFGCNKNDLYPQEKQQMIKELLNNDKLEIEALAAEIFDGIEAQTKKPLSVYARDRFLEARVIKTSGKLLADDYITPHNDPLKNPIPIRFIKVQSGVEYEFSFLLNDGMITADEKLKLFFQLLQFHGVGAKTNVGYGQFEAMDLAKFESFQRVKQEKINEEIAQLKAEQLEVARQDEYKLEVESATTPFEKLLIELKILSSERDYLDAINIYISDFDKSQRSTLIKTITSKFGQKPAPKNIAKLKGPSKTLWDIYELIEK